MNVRMVKLNEKIRRRYRNNFGGKETMMEAIKRLKQGSGRAVALYFPKGKDHDAHTVRPIVHLNSKKAGFAVTTRIRERVLYVWKAER